MPDVFTEISPAHIARITINRPDARNSLTMSVLKDLLSAFHTFSRDASVRVIVLTGSGDRAFCAGADLKEVSEFSSEERKRFFGAIADIVTEMANCPKPIVCKVHGYALAGGLGIASASDIVIASDDALFGLPEVHIGLVPMIAMVPVSRSIGRKALADLVLLGDTIDAETALSMGLVSRVVPKSELDSKVEKLAKKLSSKSPAVLTIAKKAVTDVGEKDYFKAISDFSSRVISLSGSDDTKEGIKAFLEKRSPKWPGKSEK